MSRFVGGSEADKHPRTYFWAPCARL